MQIIPATLKSWIEVDPDSHFPIQNLPFGRAKLPGGAVSVVSILGDHVIALSELHAAGLLEPTSPAPSLEGVSIAQLRSWRKRLAELFSESNSELRENREACSRVLHPLASVEPLLPIRPNAFVDFYSGIHHARNVGKMFRPDQPPLLPNYLHIPIAYNGRASSVVVDGTDIRRPKGQTKGPNDAAPGFGPTKELDFELELGFYLGAGTEIGTSAPPGRADDLMLGFVLVNDWSARDFQRWEYQPLGPFLAKSFATSISPWIVLPDALEPFRIDKLHQDPEPLAYLRTHSPRRYRIQLEVLLNGELISKSNAEHLYWSFDQQLAHQASNGTPLEAGDLYASGTISGNEPGTYGSMLELTWRGAQPLTLASGEQRSFLHDGDTLTLSGFAQGDGYRIGFGSVSGSVLPASED